MNSYKVLVDNKLTTFTYRGTDMIPTFEQVTAVFAVPFTKEGKLIAVNLFSRGYDLPGGHVDKSEKSPEETLRREVMEEASITIRSLVLSEVIESDYFDDRVSYLLLYAAFVDEMKDFVTNSESSERIEVSVDEFIAQYTVGDKELTRIAIEHAWKRLNDDTKDVVWSHKIEGYEQKDWVTLPSIFATEAVNYFPEHGSVLELGTGVGQDALYFASKGYDVTATDLYTSVANRTFKAAPDKVGNRIKTQVLDMRKRFHFADESFAIVYAHLSLHYFDHQTTVRLFDEIFRVLKPGGVFAFFTNSTTDPEYGTGKKLEDNYFFVDDFAKRYFTVETARSYVEKFSVQLLDAKGETYKDTAVGVHHLIRAIMTKPVLTELVI